MKKTLVAYFSASGVTKQMAEKLADATDADLFEIVPEVPYTEEDLDWQNDKSRSSIEMDRYERVFVGFPIWWYREPSIIDTFMESYDFTGKEVIPFASSGMSGIGDSGANMQKLAEGAKVVGGKRFPKTVKKNELKSWAKEV